MRFFFLFLFLFSSITLWAQPKMNSPYSRFGVGDIVSPYFANQGGQGGLTAAFHDPFHLNLANPASYAFLRSTALETGIFINRSNYKTGTSNQDEWSGNMTHLAIGFTLKSPINELLDKEKSPWNYGMGFSVTPYSRVGYNILVRDTLPKFGDIRNVYQGSGGLYRVAWTGAAEHKNTALGLNLGWVVGKTIYQNTTTFTDTSAVKLPTFQNNIRQDLRANGFVWNLGLQHDIVLQRAENNKDIPIRWITVGLAGNGNHSIRAIEDRFQIRSRGQLLNGTFSDADTLAALTDERREINLPAAFSLGIQYVKSNKFKLGAQVGFENWASYKNEARPENLRNTFSVSGGVEIIPDAVSFNKPLKRFRYRVGAYYRQDPRTIDGSDLNDYGITFGLGLPIVLPRQQTSFVNLSFEIGKLGVETPIEETYFRMTAGFTLNDNTWFYKRRFE